MLQWNSKHKWSIAINISKSLLFRLSLIKVTNWCHVWDLDNVVYRHGQQFYWLVRGGPITGINVLPQCLFPVTNRPCFISVELVIVLLLDCGSECKWPCTVCRNEIISLSSSGKCDVRLMIQFSALCVLWEHGLVPVAENGKYSTRTFVLVQSVYCYENKPAHGVRGTQTFDSWVKGVPTS